MKRVFVVEDEGIVALEIMDHLRDHGYEVCGHASNAEVALRQIPVARPDLVLMDVSLGKGISGVVASGAGGLEQRHAHATCP